MGEMVGKCRVFGISFRSLLQDICEKLGQTKPIYKEVVGEIGKASVQILSELGLAPVEFTGLSSHKFAESEEDAAKKAIFYLMDKENVWVEDVNCNRVMQLQNCATIVRMKMCNFGESVVESSGVEIKRETAGVSEKSQVSVSIYFQNLMIDILKGLNIISTPIEVSVTQFGQFVCFMGLYGTNTSLATQWFASDESSSWEEAEENLAKKVVCGLQARHHFVVKDINYYKMGVVALHCGLQYESYLTSKDRATTHVFEIEAEPNLVYDVNSMPTTSASKIPANSDPPPAPVKKRSAALNLQPSNVSPGGFVVVPDEFFNSGYKLSSQKPLAVIQKDA